ncbi:hypothetical Protein YC6258_04624 [Gynuella sunshinyii YC6258]|uniref:Uncharacterized protein n=1 Tax=Gynuella sunshinyii YC6258 TaxID=1445510 RepID=A0A0C5VQX5_9GAMM|nr:hypothetical Protein YC6258_04624 [Gynuella sunshinyii YC6258]
MSWIGSLLFQLKNLCTAVEQLKMIVLLKNSDLSFKKI